MKTKHQTTTFPNFKAFSFVFLVYVAQVNGRKIINFIRETCIWLRHHCQMHWKENSHLLKKISIFKANTITNLII